jgi:hypothetical protein
LTFSELEHQRKTLAHAITHHPILTLSPGASTR